MSNINEQRTVSQVQASLLDKVKPIYEGFLSAAEISDQPDSIILLAFKKEKVLEMWFSKSERFVKVATYPILGASGTSGPKLQEGDKQIPEGFYVIEGLNPNSLFYLSLRLNYPNTFDVKMANAEGRANPGSDIYIHGKKSSVGCLAMGDEAIEEIFYLVAKVGIEKVKVVISPYDLRLKKDFELHEIPWITKLYKDLNIYLNNFKKSK